MQRSWRVLALISLVLVVSGSGAAAVTVDSVASKGAGQVRSTTLSHTVSEGNDRLLTVSIGLQDTSTDKEVGSVTYDGQSLTEVANVVGDQTRVQVFQLLSPPEGTADISIDIEGGQENKIAVGAISYTDVDQIDPTDPIVSDTGQGTRSNITVASEAGDLVMDVISTDKLLSGPGDGQTEQWVQPAESGKESGGSTEAGAADVFMSWTFESGKFTHVGVNLHAAPPHLVGFEDPNGNVQQGWSRGSGTGYTEIDDGVREPTTPDTGDYIASRANDGDVSAFGFPRIAGTPANITLWVYTETGNNAEYTFRLQQDGANRCTRTVGTGSAAGWRRCTWNSVSGDLSNLTAQFGQCNKNGGGQPTNCRASAAYVEVSDFTLPDVAYTPPTPADGLTLERTFVTVNASVSDNVGVDSCLLQFDGENQSMSRNGGVCTANITGLATGDHTFKVFADDVTGHWESTPLRTVTIAGEPVQGSKYWLAGTRAPAVAQYDDGIWTDLTNEPNAPDAEIYSGTVIADRFYIGAKEGGFFRWDGTFTDLGGPQEGTVRAMASNRTHVYLGTEKKENVLYDDEAETFTSLGALPGDEKPLSASYGDGSFLVTSEEGSVLVFDGGFTDVTPTQILEGKMHANAYNGTHFLVGDEKGNVARYDGSSWRDVSAAYGFGDTTLRAAAFGALRDVPFWLVGGENGNLRRRFVNGTMHELSDRIPGNWRILEIGYSPDTETFLIGGESGQVYAYNRSGFYDVTPDRFAADGSGVHMLTYSPGPPKPVIHAPPNATITDTRPPLNVTADERIATWTFSVDGGPFQQFQPNTTLPLLSAGTHTVTVSATDGEGRTNRTSQTFTLPRSAVPQVSLDAPPQGARRTKPVDFTFTPRCFGSPCADASLLLQPVDGFRQIDTEAAWDRGVFNATEANATGWLQLENQSVSDGFEGDTLDDDWRTVDRDGTAGTTFEIASNQLNITSDGAGIDQQDDEYAAIVRTQINGSWNLTTDVVFQGGTSQKPRPGVAVRNNMSQNGVSAGYIVLAAQPEIGQGGGQGGGGGNGAILKWDSDADGFLDSSSQACANRFPMRVRLRKDGTTFTASCSTDGGATYTQIDTVTLPSASAAQDVGVFQSSQDDGVLVESTFDNFTLSTAQTTTATQVNGVYIGHYRSPVLSAGQEVDWHRPVITDDVPANTSYAIDYEENSTGIWRLHDTVASMPASAFIRFNATLRSNDSSITPAIDAVNITFSTSSLDPVKTVSGVSNATQNTIPYDFPAFSLPQRFRWNVNVTQESGGEGIASRDRIVTVTQKTGALDVRPPATFKGGEPTASFAPGDTVSVRANVTHGNVTAIDTVRLNVTAPNGTVMDQGPMRNVSTTTVNGVPGATFARNLTLGPDAAKGDWDVLVRANTTENETDSAETTFTVATLIDVTIRLAPSPGYTLRIGGFGSVWRGPVVLDAR